MSHSARASVAEFRSMLSTPVRVLGRHLQPFCRSQRLAFPANPGPRPQCLTQRRNLTLYKTATAETVLGMHKVLPFTRYSANPMQASNHLVNIVKNGQILAQDISLQNVYRQYVKPGQLLYLEATMNKKQAKNEIMQVTLAREHRTFGIFEAESLPGNKKGPQDGKGEGALRVTPLLLSSPLHYFQHALDRSYQFIKYGAPVEFHLRFKSSGLKKDVALDPVTHDSWHWIHNHFPHLRPDFILKAMPEGSKYVIKPISDGRVVQFVIGKDDARHTGPFRARLTERLFRVKEAVQQSIRKGQQAQLPKRFRSKLQREGNEAYSPMTGLPLWKPEEPEAKEPGAEEPGAEEPGAEESGAEEPGAEEPGAEELGARDAAWDRYLPEDEPRPTVRVDKLNKTGMLKGPRLQKQILRVKRRKAFFTERGSTKEAGHSSILGYRRGGAGGSG